MADDAATISQLEQQIAQLETNQRQGGGGLLGYPGGAGGGGGTYSQSMLPGEDIQGVYGLLAQYGDDPAEIGNQYVRSMQNQAAIGGQLGKPSNIREWEYYNALDTQDQKKYLEMKRGIDLKKIAGGFQSIYSPGLTDPRGVGAGGDQYSTLPEETQARMAEAAGGSLGALKATRYDTLEQTQMMRRENYSVAERLRGLVATNDLPTGQYRGLVYKVLPTADQEALDSLALQVARTKLRIEFGETRTTDEDVRNTMASIFGSRKTEEFTVDNLDRLMREIQAQESEFVNLQHYLGSVGSLPGQGGNNESFTPGAQIPTPGQPTPSRVQPPSQPQPTEYESAIEAATPEELFRELERRAAQGQQ